MSEIKLNVRHNNSTIEIPFTTSKDGLSAAIYHNGRTYYNKLVAPDAQNASKICLRRNNQTYALSLPQASETYVKPVVTKTYQTLDNEQTVRGPYNRNNPPAGIDDDHLEWFWTDEFADQEPGDIILPAFFCSYFNENNPQDNPIFLPFKVYGGKTGDELTEGQSGTHYQAGDYFLTFFGHTRRDNGDTVPVPVISFSDDYSDDNGTFYDKTGLDNYWTVGSASVVVKWKVSETTVNVQAMLLTQEGDYDYYNTLFAPNIYSPESYDEQGAAILFLEVDEGYVIESVSISGQNGVQLAEGTDFTVTDYTHNYSWYSADSSHITFTQAALDKVDNKINLTYTFYEFREP